MEPRQVELVQSSFAKVVPIKDVAAELFYNRLFEIAPETRVMFSADISEQQKKLMAALGTVVAGLKAPETILPTVKALGARHVDYGVHDSHYDTVGAALIWTLEKGLGADFTPEVKEAWIAAYTLLAGVMKEAAAEHANH